MKNLITATVLTVLAAPAWAGGTSVRGTLVSCAQHCDTVSASP